MTNSNSSKPNTSRFSTLKVFKFTSSSSSKPPPLPPKDPYYLYNRSLASLSPDSLSMPSTPLSPQYPRRPFNPTGTSTTSNPTHSNNNSTMSLVSSAASLSPTSAAELGPSVAGTIKKKSSSGKGFFKFGKRSPKSPSMRSPSREDVQAPADDEGISLPWNFQHNVHVDEGYTGLPPSWSSSLAEAGFTEDEIAAISARRQVGSRSPGSQYLYTERPRSPNGPPPLPLPPSQSQLNGPLSSNVNAPVLTRPTPRTTSLPRKRSDASLGQQPSPPQLQPPPIPGGTGNSINGKPNPSISIITSSPSSQHKVPIRKFSTSSSSSRSVSAESEAQYLYTNSDAGANAKNNANGIASVTATPPMTTTTITGPSAPPNAIASLSSSNEPSPPPPPPPLHLQPAPRRTFHVTNRTPVTPTGGLTNNIEVSQAILSPPPAYSTSYTGNSSGFPADKKEKEQSKNGGVGGFMAQGKSPERDVREREPRPSTDTTATSSSSASASASASASPSSSGHSRTSTTSSTRSKRRSKRFTALPPRLSLHEDGGADLTLWSEALISAIPSELLEGGGSSGKDSSGSKDSTGGQRAEGGKWGKGREDRGSIFAAAQAGLGSGGLGSSTSQVPTARPGGDGGAGGRNGNGSGKKPPPPTRAVPTPPLGSGGSGSGSGSRQKLPSPSTSNPKIIVQTAATSLADDPRTQTQRRSPMQNPSQSQTGLSPTSPWDNISPSSADQSRSPSWDELLGVVGGMGGGGLGLRLGIGAGGEAEEEDEPYTPALSESWSPVLPVSPPARAEGLGVGRGRGVVDAIGEMRSQSQGPQETRRTREQPQEKEVPGTRPSSSTFLDTSTEERDSNRDSSTSTSTVTGATIVRNVSVARRAVANVIPGTISNVARGRGANAGVGGVAALGRGLTKPNLSPSPSPTSPVRLAVTEVGKGRYGLVDARYGSAGSLQSSRSGSEERSGSGSGSGSSSSHSHDHLTPMTEGESSDSPSPLHYYMEPSPLPTKTSFSPTAALSPHHGMLVSATDTFGGVLGDDGEEGDEEYEDEEEAEEPEHDHSGSADMDGKPAPVINAATSHAKPDVPNTLSPVLSPSSLSPLSPLQRYRGWLSVVVKPLEEFIDDTVDPRDFYLNLQEIAEGESGSVYAAHLVSSPSIHRLKLPPLVKVRDADDLTKGRDTLVAIKNVPILPSGSPKLVDLRKELALMRGIGHEHILGMDAVYVDLVEDSLWIRMELMERSLADVVGLVEEGLMLQDRMIARFASDVLLALEYLRKQHIAHRDVRSDNLLLNSQGVLKLTDFSSAVHVPPDNPMSSDPVGVMYWQAPEVRSGSYNALKVDVWSLGATVWEMAQAEPPFSNQPIGDRWPPLTQPDLYSPGFHDFLRQCSEPAASRPDPSDLTKTSFIHNACGRPVIIQLLSQCMAIEKILQEGDDAQEPNSP